MVALHLKIWLVGLLVFCGWLFHGERPANADDILIFAAASLATPVQEIVDHQANNNIRVSFAASSTLARQISKGAPADIFISANQKWMDYLAKTSPVIAASKHAFLSNSLVLISPAKSRQTVKTYSAKLLINLLGDSRLAIGDPDHVPLGIYTRQALTNLKLWKPVQNKLARLNNARAVLAFVERGATPAGIAYGSDAYRNPKVDVIFQFPSSSHTAITYWMALTGSRQNPTAQQFFNILLSQSAKDVFKRHGFLVN